MACASAKYAEEGSPTAISGYLASSSNANPSFYARRSPVYPAKFAGERLPRSKIYGFSRSPIDYIVKWPSKFLIQKPSKADISVILRLQDSLECECESSCSLQDLKSTANQEKDSELGFCGEGAGGEAGNTVWKIVSNLEKRGAPKLRPMGSLDLLSNLISCAGLCDLG